MNLSRGEGGKEKERRNWGERREEKWAIKERWNLFLRIITTIVIPFPSSSLFSGIVRKQRKREIKKAHLLHHFAASVTSWSHFLPLTWQMNSLFFHRNEFDLTVSKERYQETRGREKEKISELLFLFFGSHDIHHVSWKTDRKLPKDTFLSSHETMEWAKERLIPHFLITDHSILRKLSMTDGEKWHWLRSLIHLIRIELESTLIFLSLPSAVIDCGRPEVPSSAELITPTSSSFSDPNGIYTVGAEIKIKCKPGHKYIGGSETRKCSRDGKWDGNGIECKCECDIFGICLIRLSRVILIEVFSESN